MELATLKDKDGIMNFYESVVEAVNQTDVRLGWDTKIYPDDYFVQLAINKNEMHIVKEDGVIVAAAVVNHNVNPEYNDIPWDITGPEKNIATIHALATAPDCRGKKLSDRFLAEIEDYCRKNGDKAVHLDVIDTNIPAYKLYIRNKYEEKACIKMFYEVVGTREFWMLEKIL